MRRTMTKGPTMVPALERLVGGESTLTQSRKRWIGVGARSDDRFDQRIERVDLAAAIGKSPAERGFRARPSDLFGIETEQIAARIGQLVETKKALELRRVEFRCPYGCPVMRRNTSRSEAASRAQQCLRKGMRRAQTKIPPSRAESEASVQNHRRMVSWPAGARVQAATVHRVVTLLERALPIAILALAVIGAPVMMLAPEGLPGSDHSRKNSRKSTGNGELRQQIQHLRGRVQHLREDPVAVERIARDELGLVRTSEVVFQFPRGRWISASWPSAPIPPEGQFAVVTWSRVG